MKMLNATVEIGTNSAKLNENGIDELNMTSDSFPKKYSYKAIL
jgi:hypothetical protein